MGNLAPTESPNFGVGPILEQLPPTHPLRLAASGGRIQRPTPPTPCVSIQMRPAHLTGNPAAVSLGTFSDVLDFAFESTDVSFDICTHCGSNIDGRRFMRHLYRAFLCENCFSQRKEIGYADADWTVYLPSKKIARERIYESFYAFRSRSGRLLVVIHSLTESVFQVTCCCVNWVYQTFEMIRGSRFDGYPLQRSFSLPRAGKWTECEFHIDRNDYADDELRFVVSADGSSSTSGEYATFENLTPQFRVFFGNCSNPPEMPIGYQFVPPVCLYKVLRAMFRACIFPNQIAFECDCVTKNALQGCRVTDVEAEEKRENDEKTDYSARPSVVVESPGPFPSMCGTRLCCGREWAMCSSCQRITFSRSPDPSERLRCRHCQQILKRPSPVIVGDDDDPAAKLPLPLPQGVVIPLRPKNGSITENESGGVPQHLAARIDAILRLDPEFLSLLPTGTSPAELDLMEQLCLAVVQEDYADDEDDRLRRDVALVALYALYSGELLSHDEKLLRVMQQLIPRFEDARSPLFGNFHVEASVRFRLGAMMMGFRDYDAAYDQMSKVMRLQPNGFLGRIAFAFRSSLVGIRGLIDGDADALEEASSAIRGLQKEEEELVEEKSTNTRISPFLNVLGPISRRLFDPEKSQLLMDEGEGLGVGLAKMGSALVASYQEYARKLAEGVEDQSIPYDPARCHRSNVDQLIGEVKAIFQSVCLPDEGIGGSHVKTPVICAARKRLDAAMHLITLLPDEDIPDRSPYTLDDALMFSDLMKSPLLFLELISSDCRSPQEELWRLFDSNDFILPSTPDPAIVYYLILDCPLVHDCLLRFVFASGLLIQFDRKEVPSPFSRSGKSLLEIIRFFQENRTGKGRPFPFILADSGFVDHQAAICQDLNDFLLGGLESLIHSAERVIIIPDRHLFRVPFQCCLDEHGKFLVERVPVLMCFSVRLFRHLCSLSQEDDTEEPEVSVSQESSIYSLVCGDAVQIEGGRNQDFDSEVRLVTSAFSSRTSSCEISGELERRQQTVVTLRGCHFTPHLIRRSCEMSPRFIHFVAHGSVQQENEDENTREVLDNFRIIGRMKCANETVLGAEDVSSFNLRRTELAFLNCCSLCDGKLQNVGILGFGRALLLAGCSSVVSALWKVSSSFALVFADLFYKYRFSGHQTNAEAARNALLEVFKLGVEEFSADGSGGGAGRSIRSLPCYWGAFSVFGAE